MGPAVSNTFLFDLATAVTATKIENPEPISKPLTTPQGAV